MSAGDAATITALAPTGVIGSGFPEEHFWAAVRSRRPDFIGVDAGSSDPGPHALGTAVPKYPRFACKRDLRPILVAAGELRVPVLIGSAGTSGADAGVDWTRDIVAEIAREEGLEPRVAAIYAEQDRGYLKRALAERRVKSLPPHRPLEEATVERAERIVAMMGAEPFVDALADGADVVIAGRATDTAIFAAVPLMRGAPPGLAWHAAKVLECGAGAVAERTSPDGLLASIAADCFEVEPVNPSMRCTPASVAAHSLYENPSPYFLVEPGGTVDTREAVYEAVSDRRVRVSGSRFAPAARYSVRLEGAERVGYQSIVLAGIRDPRVVGDLDPWLAQVRERATARIDAALAGEAVDYSLVLRVYGRDAMLGVREPLAAAPGHEVGLVLEVTAPTQELATGLVSMASHTALHNPIPGWHGLVSALAYPYSPAELERGLVFRFSLNHVVFPSDPREPFRTTTETVR